MKTYLPSELVVVPKETIEALMAQVGTFEAIPLPIFLAKAFDAGVNHELDPSFYIGKSQYLDETPIQFNP